MMSLKDVNIDANFPPDIASSYFSLASSFFIMTDSMVLSSIMIVMLDMQVNGSVGKTKSTSIGLSESLK